LQEEAKSPSGQVPQFLVVSEIQRRTDMRNKYKDPNEEQPQGTIADQITQEGIASVQPQQPPQGQPPQEQPQQMQAYGGGMTPFMRKYASGGVVRMQEGGITPHDMAQMDAQMMAQKYPFLSGSRDEILQGLDTVDPNDFSYISSMFNGAPEIEAVLASRAPMPQPPMPIENITTPSLLELDGVNTLTPNGRRPNPDAPSLDTLDQFSNAFKEDAKRANLLLATLNDATPEQEEAISNPVDIDLPRTLEEIGKEAPQMLPLSAKKINLTGESTELDLTGESANAELDQARREQLLLRSEALGGSSAGRSGLSDAPTGGKTTNTVEPEAEGYGFSRGARKPLGRTASNMQGALIGAEKLDELTKPFFDQFDVDLKKTPDQRREEASRELKGRYLDPSATETRFGSSSVSESANNTFNMMDSLKPVNNTSTSVGTDTTNSGVGVRTEEQQLKAAEKGASLLDKLLGLGLEGDKKQAYAMALMALGKGISDGDTAGGLQNAGLAANAIMEQSADRRDKKLDREITSSYYKEKLQDTRDSKKADMNYKIQTLYNKYLETAIGATDKQKADELERITLSITGNLGDTVATGDNINNQRNAANVNFNTLKT